MASIISAGTTSGTALNLTGDTSGNLAFQTGAGAYTITVPNETGTIITNKTAGTVLQVVQTSNGTNYSTSSNAWSSTFSLSITPKFSTSKILVLINLVTRKAASNYIGIQLYKNSSFLAYLTEAANFTNSNTYASAGYSNSYLDSPATTSSTTYQIYFSNPANTGTVSINPDGTDRSSIVLMEIAA